MKTSKKPKIEGVEFEISLDEVYLLKLLLNFETVFQIRHLVGAKDSDEKKTQLIFVAFEAFRDFDERLIFLENFLIKSAKIAGEHGTEFKNLIVMNKGILKVCKILCEETTKLPMPDLIKSKWEKHGPELVKKLEKALEAAKPIDLLKKNPSEPDSGQKDSKEKGPVVNIFGKGYA